LTVLIKLEGEEMKMGFIFSGVFWGIVVVVLGILLILKALGLAIPVGKVFWGLLFIYIGISIIFWSFGGCSRKPGRMMYNDFKVEADGKQDKYSILFGSGDIDLTKIDVKEKTVKIEVTNVFAECYIRLNPEIPTKVFVTSAFGGAVTPDKTDVAFGSYTYKNSKYKEGANYLFVEAHVVFAGLKIVEQSAPKAEEKK